MKVVLWGFNLIVNAAAVLLVLNATLSDGYFKRRGLIRDLRRIVQAEALPVQRSFFNELCSCGLLALRSYGVHRVSAERLGLAANNAPD